MPSTLIHQITYPGGAQAPNVPVDMQAQAQSVEAALNALRAGFGIASTTVGNSRFTRTWDGTQGTVTAHIVISVGGAVVPANSQTGLLVGGAGYVPVGYRPLYTLGNAPAVISGNGQGYNVQYVVNTGGDVLVRSGATGFTSVASTVLIIETSWAWDGNL